MQSASKSLCVVAVLVFGSSLAVLACDSDEGEPGPIPGGGGTSSGTTAPTSSDQDAGPEAGAPLKKAAEVGCAVDAECESQVCFVGNKQGFCTVRCTTDNAAELCVAPYTGTCNKQGYCKRD